MTESVDKNGERLISYDEFGFRVESNETTHASADGADPLHAMALASERDAGRAQEWRDVLRQYDFMSTCRPNRVRYCARSLAQQPTS